MSLQLHNFNTDLNLLQQQFGNTDICSINGGGCINNPKLFFLFMNPTARNISSRPTWTGLRAPWIGTKNVWKIFYRLSLISDGQFQKIQKYKPNDWTVEFATSLYQTLSDNKVYITNLAKCTQVDARPLNNKVFKKYLDLTLKEIEIVNPQIIISFGVQVSSILLGKKINLKKPTEESTIINNTNYPVYPTYYPVGQGMRNMEQAIERISTLL